MRNRSLFLNSSSSPFAPSLPSEETLTFLNLPSPHLPPDPFPSLADHCLLCFDSISPFDLCCEIEKFPIDSVLSNILRDILPDFIEVDDEGFKTAPIGTRSGLGDGATEGEEAAREDEEDGKYHHENSVQGAEVPPFETPELQIYLDNPHSVDKEAMDIFFQVSEIESTEDATDLGLQLQCTFVAQETMALVGDSGLDHPIQSEANLLEDDDPGEGDPSFPLLEVNEMSLTTLSSMCMEEEVEKFLVVVEPQPLTSKEDLEIVSSSSLILKEECFLEYPFFQKQCLQYDLPSSDKLLERDFLSILEHSTSFLAPANRDCVIPGTLPIFENVQVLDVDSLLLGDVLQYQKLIEHESCNEMQQEEVRLNGFQELIISQELSPVDNIFKSFHVPTLPDCLIMRPLYAIVEEVLVNLKPCPPSASDGIYLDWHLLEKDGCKDFVLSSSQIMLEVIELLSLESDWDTSAAEKVVYNFIFGECTTNDSCDECCTEPLNMLSDGCSVHNRCLSGSSCMPSNDTCRMPETERLASECNSNGASFLLESMSTFDDLNFFLNPSKATAGNSLLNAAEVHRGRTLKVPTCGSLSEVSWSEHHSGPWTIKIYLVKLSDEIVSVSECLKESYLGLLEGDARFKAAHKSLSEATDSYSLLKVPKQVFMDCMKKANSVTPDLIQCAEYVGVFAALCAIKQLAWYMCFYGLRPARLYIDKLCQLDGFKSRLSRLRHIVSSVDGASHGPITTSHPSLSVIQEVLLSNSNPKGVKALILAERIFWQCVKCLLTSMGMSFHELKIWQVNGSPNVNMENLLDKDCLLASFEQISSCFPFDKFGIILEHGGACHSSRISSLHPSLFTLPQLHFLKVELGEWSSSLALCEGVSSPLNSSNIVEGTSLGRTGECMDVWELERIIDFVPYKDEGLTSSNKPFSEEPSPNPLESPLTESDCYQPKKVFVRNKAIVVNTQNSNEAMIVSRRSTYQKILSLEKVGIQVIERDSNLPVDIMLNTSTCLVWYTCQNIGKKASGPTEGYSWLQSYVENIATNVLTLLSFSFGACVLIFEGDIGFISTVMESSDGLYAAAVGLGIHIQLFCSYSPELTDEIILNCITSEAKPRDGLYLALTESESLAESFLTKFPSINPLIANAILSSGTTLVDFLEWSNECRASTLEKYGVPEESISLFTALCRYGELEDSHSIMTDCSSSVSSGPDSKSCQNKFDSGRKQCHPENPDKFAMCINDSLQFQNSKCPIDRTGEHSEIGRLPEKFEDIQIPSDPKIRDHSFNGLHSEIGQISARSSTVPSNQKAFQSHEGVFNENLGLFNELNHSDWTDQEWADVMVQKTGGKEIFHSDPVVSACGQSTSFLPEMGKVGRKYSLDADESSFGEIDCLTFPLERALDFASSLPNYVEEWQFLPGLTGDALFSEQNRDDLSMNKNNRSMDGNMGRFSQRPYTDSHEIPAREDNPNDRGTPLRSALSSPHLGKGSPWTIEFLNRIREKSKVRRQLLPPEASPRPDVARHVSNPPKRRSPSILEFFKYRGGGTIPRTAEQKGQKKAKQSAGSSGNRKMSASFVPTWTPIDKKSSQVLSFSTNGSGSQTKLVWSDGCRYPSVGRNLRSSML